MLLQSLTFSFLISVRGIMQYFDWVGITAPDYCCKDLVSFSATQKYQIPVVPGTAGYLMYTVSLVTVVCRNRTLEPGPPACRFVSRGLCFHRV